MAKRTPTEMPPSMIQDHGQPAFCLVTLEGSLNLWVFELLEELKGQRWSARGR